MAGCMAGRSTLASVSCSYDIMPLEQQVCVCVCVNVCVNPQTLYPAIITTMTTLVQFISHLIATNPLMFMAFCLLP